MRISDWSSDVCSSDLAISVQYLFPGWNRAMLQRENRDPPREVVQSVLPVARRQYQSEPPDGRRESERRREEAAWPERHGTDDDPAYGRALQSSDFVQAVLQLVPGQTESTYDNPACAGNRYATPAPDKKGQRSEEHTYELQSLMRIS